MAGLVDETYLTKEEVAERIGVSERAVRGWIQTGKLEAIDLGGRGGHRILERSLERFLTERKVKAGVSSRMTPFTKAGD